MSINQASISGNLTRDAELRQSQNGMAVLRFSVAVNERQRNRQTNEYENRPSYIDCVLFGNLGPVIADRMVRGARVAVSGRLRQDRWQAQDGSNRSRLEIIASEVETMGGGGQRRQQRPVQAPQGYGQVAQAVQAGFPEAQVREMPSNPVPAPAAVVQQAQQAFGYQQTQQSDDPSVYDDDIPF